MLEKAIVDQLKSVFSKLEKQVELRYAHTDHPKNEELIELLYDVSETSPKILVKKGKLKKEIPFVEIIYEGKENGIQFSGIPSGHEFTSLILAILNSDKKGKLPDEMILERIQNIKGPLHVKTYISLSCENCPEVVQALNIITIFNPAISHEMIDGSFLPKEIEELGIQGVPSVISEGKLLSSGKTTLIKLIERLEDKFGKNEASKKKNTSLGHYDVTIIGGGPAGASASIYSARKGLKTLIISENLGGQLKDTKGIENFTSIPYTEGPQLTGQLINHINKYEIKVLENRRIVDIENSKSKKLILDSGEYVHSKSIIVATGAKWRELNVPGEKEYKGQGVAYCPHCDGPYYKNKKIAIVGGGNSGVEAALDLAEIVDHITLIEFMPDLKADEVLIEKLLSLNNLTILKNAQVTEVLGDNNKVIAIQYKDRETESINQVELDGIFVQIGLSPNSQFIRSIVETNNFGEIVIDDKCRTNIEGIYAAGDVTNVPYKQIIISMGEGAKAALTAFTDQKITNKL